MVKVIVESNLDIWGERAELELESRLTLKELLGKISAQIHFPIIDPKSGQVDPLLQLRLNGREHVVLPQRLDTPLHDGDVLEMEVNIAQGG